MSHYIQTYLYIQHWLATFMFAGVMILKALPRYVNFHPGTPLPANNEIACMKIRASQHIDLGVNGLTRYFILLIENQFDTSKK